MEKTSICFLTISLLVTLSASLRQIDQFELNSSASIAVLAPFLEGNSTLAAAVSKMTTLDKDLEFAPLFQYITSNSSVFQAVLPNISIVQSFKWASSMDSQQQRELLSNMLQSNLDIVYNLLFQNFFLGQESNCQEFFDAILAINETQTTQLILKPVSVDYFKDKRCLLLYTDVIDKIDQIRDQLGLVQDDQDSELVVSAAEQQEEEQQQEEEGEIQEFTLSEKLGLVPTIKRVRIVHSLIFDMK